MRLCWQRKEDPCLLRRSSLARLPPGFAEHGRNQTLLLFHDKRRRIRACQIKDEAGVARMETDPHLPYQRVVHVKGRSWALFNRAADIDNQPRRRRQDKKT